MVSFGLGPLVISVGQAVMIVALVVALVAGKLAARRGDVPIVDTLFTLALVGLLIARVAFVVRYFPSYGWHPLAWLDIRDGGFEIAAGLLGMVFYSSTIVRRRPSLRRPLGAATLASALAWGLLHGALTFIEPPSKALPAAPLQTLDGTPTDLAKLRDKAGDRPMVVNLWASWCPPCRREMPVLERAQKRNSSVVFIFANQAESVATIRHFLNKLGLDLKHVVRDPRGHLARQIGSAGLPTTLFYNARGRLVDTHLGALSRATLARALEHLKSGSKNPSANAKEST